MQSKQLKRAQISQKTKQISGQVMLKAWFNKIDYFKGFFSEFRQIERGKANASFVFSSCFATGTYSRKYGFWGDWLTKLLSRNVECLVVFTEQHALPSRRGLV